MLVSGANEHRHHCRTHRAPSPPRPTTPARCRPGGNRDSRVEQAYHAGAAVAHIHLRDENERPIAGLEHARRAMTSSWRSGVRS